VSGSLWAIRTDLAGAARILAMAVFLVLELGVLPVVFASTDSNAAEAEQERAVMMRRFIVSATRIDKNPWRYASLPGYEVLTRASDAATKWWLDGLRRGLALENDVVPKDWLTQSAVPDTVIIDETNLESIPASQLHTRPIEFQQPADDMAWGSLSGRPRIWTDHNDAHDQDTYAVNANVYGVDTSTGTCVISLRRLFHSTPPLPNWLIAGLLGENCGVFRDGFMPYVNFGEGERIRYADGPGTLWVSLDETQQLLKELKKDKNAKVDAPALGTLFSEAPIPARNRLLLESEAGLFVRWGLMGPGSDSPEVSRGFLEFVRRSRREPATERMFTECFGVGYAAMDERLGAFLRTVLAKPTTVKLDIRSTFGLPEFTEATADQIGRILGDWLRMKGDSLRGNDSGMGRECLDAAGRMLERAYREDNGLPPDVDPSRGGGTSAAPPSGGSARGAAVVMKPFVVSADRIHDPGLLAVYGLYEHDVGNDRKARELLEAAAKAGVVRPGAYLVLGELRLEDATAKPLGPGGKLSAEQAAFVLEPLHAAMRGPPVPGVYGLIVETWGHCVAKPGAGDIEEIAEGVARFPRITPLAYRSALLCAQSGYPAEAAKLIDKGLLFATRSDIIEHFERLRSTLPPAPKDGSR
jgi:hypothetical protein